MPFIGSVSGSQGFGRGSTTGLPVWVSSGSLGTLTDAQRAGGNTLTANASPGPGATSVTYSLVTGSLPAGASLNSSNGVISGFSAVSSNTTSSFTLRATNNAGLTADAALSITINAVTITWTSPVSQTFGGQNTGASFSQTYVASASSGTIAYTVVSGSIQSGTSVASNGSHTGTLSGATTTYNWTIRATVTSGSATATVDQSFAQVVTSAGLYSFTNVTFTPGGAAGVSGPSLGQIHAGMSGSPDPSGYRSTYVTSNSGKIRWTVPITGTYRITAAGARASDYTVYGTTSNGASLRGDFSLTQGEVLELLVGHQGQGDGNGFGAGGGTFVVRSPYNSTGNVLIAAGGAGSTHPNQSPNSSWQPGAANQQSGRPGSQGPSAGGSGGGGGVGQGGGGAGFSGNGSQNGGSPGSASGISYTNGGQGGPSGRPNGQGGFGGGGGYTNSWGAGGGGYSGGGGGGQTPWQGGGGGSINNGSSQSNSDNANNGNGFVTIQRL